ncbi:MAG: tripartite tricarboxylate transporter substrate binding protein [Pseudomonadota bacterium]
MNAISRILVQLLSSAALMVLAGSVLAQQDYPNKPIRIISPFSPGGSVTITARLVGHRLTERWGQNVIVDNRPGGNTIIGSEALVRSPPDGYTLLLITSTHVVNQSLFKTPYDAIKDFAAVATVARTAQMLVVNNKFPAETVREVIALLKANPGKFNFASSGIGTTNHMAGEFFKLEAGVDMRHIPYKGGGPAITDLLGGQVQLSFQAPATAMSLIKANRVRAIAVASQHRMLALPDLPTFSESGLPGFDASFWYGILAPASTPVNILKKLSTEIASILATPEFKKDVENQGMEPFVSTPEEFAALMKADLAKYAKIIKEANITVK